MYLREFKVNNLITLKLLNGKTVIFVDGEEFKHCKAILFKIPINKIANLKNVESIDELAERMYILLLKQQLSYLNL